MAIIKTNKQIINKEINKIIKGLNRLYIL
jgi:hypothetical protein